MTEQAESGPIQARNLIKEAWIKLATDKNVIHALRTLSNEDVRNALLTDEEWREFVTLVSGRVGEGVRFDLPSGRSNVTHLIQTSFLVHLSVWFVFVSLAVSAFVWWFGSKRGWWGQSECFTCSHRAEKRMSQSSPEQVSNVNFSKEMGSLRESFFGEKCDCAACCGSQLTSLSAEDCVSTAYHISPHSQTSQNFTGEFKNFFHPDDCTTDEVMASVMVNKPAQIDYKMWFLVAMVVCMSLSALICAMQIINLEEKFLTLSGYAIKCRNLVPPNMSPGSDKFLRVEAGQISQPDNLLDCSIPQDSVTYPAQIVTESEKPKNQASRKSSQTKAKRSSRSKSSRKPHTSSRSKREIALTEDLLKLSKGSLENRENNAKQDP